MKTQTTDEMVNRFLSWNLPADFMPDCYIAFKHPGGNASWPSGTNLLNAAQAREMLEHVMQMLPESDDVMSCEIKTWQERMVPAMPPYVEADEIQGAMLAEIDDLRQKLAAVESQTAIPAQVQQYPACITMEAAYEMGSKGAKPTESERLLFESWMRGHCWAVIGKWDGRTYTETGSVHDGAVGHTRQLWAVWRDRAALCASPSNTQKT